jgi:hypothetical protein
MDIGNVDDMDRNTRFPPPSRLLAYSIRTSFESPWRNGVAERWVESCRRDLLDHVIAVNERHLKRFLSEYVRCFHEDRTHLGLRKATPSTEYAPPPPGGFFLRFDWAGCIIVTIGLPDLDQLFTDPYICTPDERS